MTTIPQHTAFAGTVASGLTKREYFASLALQALVQYYGYRFAPSMAVKAADELIKELNSVKPLEAE
jgi:hypothetical protein